MGIVGIFKTLFGPLKPKQEENVVVEEKVAVEPVIQSREVFKERCESCNAPIYKGEPFTKPPQTGMYYHRKCWKEVMKKAWGN